MWSGYTCNPLTLQALTDLVEFAAERTRAGSSGLQDLAQGLDALQGQELRDVQWGVALLIERCYWSLCQPTAGRSLNVKVSTHLVILPKGPPPFGLGLRVFIFFIFYL